ncbi:MAG: T9SS type A sorting domain-containing protein, partial [candidate division WOR-3 bacterium]
NEACCGGYYAAYKPEGQTDFILNPELIVGATDYILEVPYPSTQYELQIITANYDEEPTELVSNSLFATTHPRLSARVNYSLDPSNSSKFVESGDKVYLVHEDQDRVWLAIGTKSLGKVIWEEDEVLISDALDSRDPAIAVDQDGRVWCAFVDGVVGNEIWLANYRQGDLWPHMQKIYRADQAIPAPAVFNLDMAYDPQGYLHLVWEEHREKGGGYEFQVKYGLFNLNSSFLTTETVNEPWTLRGNGGLAFAYPDVELMVGRIPGQPATPMVAFMRPQRGVVAFERANGNWDERYSSEKKGFSGNPDDYGGFDLGISNLAGAGYPFWPFLAFTYKNAGVPQVYFASPYSGINWQTAPISAWDGNVEKSMPFVAWYDTVALVGWVAKDALRGDEIYLRPVYKSGLHYQFWPLKTTKGIQIFDPHILLEPGNTYTPLWLETNPQKPPAYLVKYDRRIPPTTRVDIATPQITGPLGGDYTVYYTTDGSVKELWFLLSHDRGNTFPDTILHQVNPPAKDSVKLRMPDYPTKSLRLGVLWKDTLGMNSMVIPVRSVIASSGPFLTYGNNSKKIISSQGGELHLVYSTGDPISSVWPPDTPKVFWTKSQDFGETWNVPTLLGQGFLPGLAIRSFPNGEEALACAWLRPDGTGKLDLMYSYKEKNSASWSSPVSLGKVNYMMSAPGLAIDTKGKKVHISVDDYKDGTKLHELLYFSGKYDKPNKITRTVVSSWTAALPPKDTVIFPVPMPVESLSADTAIKDSLIVVNPLLCPSVAVDYNGGVHMAWDDRAQGVVYYGYKGPDQPNWNVLQISHPGRYARNPSLDVYGAQVYITWEEDQVYFQRWGYVDQPMSFLAEDTLFTYEPTSAYPFTRKGAGVAWNWWSKTKEGLKAGVDFARYLPSQDVWERDSIRVFMGLSRANPSFESYWDKSKAFDYLVWTSSFVSHFYNLYPLPPESTHVPPGWPMSNPLWYFVESQVYPREMADVSPFYALWLGTPNPTPYTHERDTFMVYENGIRVDYDADKLVYRFPFMEARSELMLILDLYYEGTEPQRRVRVEVGNDNLGDYPYSSGQKTRLTIELPDWVSGSEDVRITLKNHLGEAVEAAGLMIMAYAKKEGQGGPASLPGELTPPFALYAPYPNPAKGKLTIQFSVPSGANTSLVLYDIMGRRVSNLYQGNEPGLHILTWDGTGDNGSSLPAGVYFLRLTHGSGRSAVRKVVWMR